MGGALALRTGEAVKLDVIALQPEVRRQGVGRRRMQAIEAEAIRMGADGIYLGRAKRIEIRTSISDVAALETKRT